MSQMLEDPFVHHHRLMPPLLPHQLPHEIHLAARHDAPPGLARAYGVWLLATLCSGGLMASLLWAFETVA